MMGRRFSMAKPSTNHSSGTIQTPTSKVPDTRLELSEKSKPNSSGISSPVSITDSIRSGTPTDWNTSITTAPNTRDSRSPLLERRNSNKAGNNKKKGGNSDLFGSAISLVDVHD